MLPSRSSAFALIGPYESWMDPTNAYHLPGDIGGPMDIQCGYRWNVPILTYGFDQSFLDFFGTNGVTAVKEAIAILNGLPPASGPGALGYPSNTRNQSPVGGNLYDLKSATLAALLQQLGLAQPVRHTFDFRKWDARFTNCFDQACWGDWAMPDYIICRNYDPQTLNSSFYVNGNLYSSTIYSYWPSVLSPPGYSELWKFMVDPLAIGFNAVAENLWSFDSEVDPSGSYYTGLTSDDVGGLQFLLSTNHTSWEPLLPDVTPLHLHGPNNSQVNGAWRLGVDKLVFVEHPHAQSGQWHPFSYQFVGQYLAGNHVKKQNLQRIVSRPDFLFVAADNGEGQVWTLPIVSTDTSGWLNLSGPNGVASQAGPGLIVPPVAIAFQKLGMVIQTGDDPSEPYPWIVDSGWSRLDGSTNLPIRFPGTPQESESYTIRLRARSTDSASRPIFANQTWHLKGGLGAQANLQVSTNQVDWTTLAVATNSGAVLEWQYWGSTNPTKSFRIQTQ